jgi:hypothetical protein
VEKLVGTNWVYDQRRQIVSKSIEFMRLALPLICNKIGEWIKINHNNFTQLEFTLCDFMIPPVIIHAPIHNKLEVKIKPINSNRIIHALLKDDVPQKVLQPPDT